MYRPDPHLTREAERLQRFPAAWRGMLEL